MGKKFQLEGQFWVFCQSEVIRWFYQIQNQWFLVLFVIQLVTFFGSPSQWEFTEFCFFVTLLIFVERNLFVQGAIVFLLVPLHHPIHALYVRMSTFYAFGEILLSQKSCRGQDLFLQLYWKGHVPLENRIKFFDGMFFWRTLLQVSHFLSIVLIKSFKVMRLYGRCLKSVDYWFVRLSKFLEWICETLVLKVSNDCWQSFQDLTANVLYPCITSRQ